MLVRGWVISQLRIRIIVWYRGFIRGWIRRRVNYFVRRLFIGYMKPWVSGKVGKRDHELSMWVKYQVGSIWFILFVLDKLHISFLLW